MEDILEDENEHRERNLHPHPNNNIKIVTVNIPSSYIETLAKLVEKTGLSRSEIVRIATREYILDVIKRAKAIRKKEPETIEDCEVFNNHNAQGLVKIPIEGENGETFKTFKILKVLNSPVIEAKPKLVKPKYRKQIPLGRNFPNDPFSNLGPEPNFVVDEDFRKKLTEGLGK